MLKKINLKAKELRNTFFNQKLTIKKDGDVIGVIKLDKKKGLSFHPRNGVFSISPNKFAFGSMQDKEVTVEMDISL
jgi:hypothetical protein